jgi:hypothetical protein
MLCPTPSYRSLMNAKGETISVQGNVSIWISFGGAALRNSFR